MRTLTGRTRLFVALAVALCVAAGMGVMGAEAADEAPAAKRVRRGAAVPGEFMVKFAPGRADEAMALLSAGSGIEMKVRVNKRCCYEVPLCIDCLTRFT